MQELVQRILDEGEHVGGGIVKVDSFLNHQVDPQLTWRMAKAMHDGFLAEGVRGITRVLTAEVSGIPVAQMIYARKSHSRTMTGTYYVAEAISRTRGISSELMVDRRFLKMQDRVLIIDDFLATGATLTALAKLVGESGAELCGIGCVIEKPEEGGRDVLVDIDVPVITLAKIRFGEAGLQVSA